MLATATSADAEGGLADAFAFRLLNDFQRGFPLVRAPFAEMAAALASTQERVLDALHARCADGSVSRVGAVFAPNTVGASALAALSVPEAALEGVAALASARAEVNHNYEREGDPNLWFVLTAAGAAGVERAAREIESAAGCGPVLLLPLIDEYRIDLGFDLAGKPQLAPATLPRARPGAALCAADRRVVQALQTGLPLVPAPFQALATSAGLNEEEVLARLREWLAAGVIRRFGVILRHHELGYAANAMSVWDVPDDRVTEAGLRLARQPGVTLCYRRQRAGLRWPFNLYCMIHGRTRGEVEARLATLAGECGLRAFDSRVLFSRRRFKQRGAHYVGASGDA
jgi:DNA-binding Lrp family transcriptional regulator